MNQAEGNPMDSVWRAVLEGDPRILLAIQPWTRSHDRLNELRDIIANASLSLEQLDSLYGWMWHPDDVVSHIARIVVLFLDDPLLRASVLTRLATEEQVREMPFNIRYNGAEKEYLVDIEGVPGWGISEYSRDDPQSAALLRALDRLYEKLHGGDDDANSDPQ